MKKIFKEFKNSIYGPDYYRDLLDQPLSYSIKYYWALTLLIGIIVTIIFSAILVPVFNSFAWNLRGAVLEIYPEDLEIKIIDGQVSSNKEEPIKIDLPDSFGELVIGGVNKVKNLLVIDTNKDIEFSEYETFILLSKDTLSYYKGISGDIVTESFSPISDLTLSRNSIQTFFDSIEPYYKFVTPLIVLGLFMFAVIVMLLTMVYLLLVALLVWLIARLRGWNIKYIKAYQLSLHFATLGFIVYWLTFLIFDFSNVLILFTVCILLLTLLTFKKQSIS